jgi:hypothetical protein
MYLIHWPVAEIPPDQGVVIAGDPASEDVQLWETFEAMKLLKAEVRHAELCRRGDGGN